jgi:hypothetical protein
LAIDCPAGFDPRSWIGEPDTDAPVWTSTPSVSNILATTVDLTVNTDEPGTAYYVAVADGAAAPTSAQVVAGTDAGDGAAINGNIAIAAASTDYTGTITGLTASTAYDIYVVAQDDESTPNLQATPELVNVTTADPDITAPLWTATYPKTANVANNDFDLLVNIDEIGKAYYVVLANDVTAPTPAQAKAGQDGTGAAALKFGTIDITTAATEFSVNISGLAAGTIYDVYVVAEDDETVPNVQAAVAAIADVTTTAILDEPTNHVTDLAATALSTSITVTWTDAVAGTQVPENYLVMINNTGTFAVADFTPIADDTDFSDDAGAKNIAHGTGTCTFSDLTAGTTYHIRVYSYTNSGAAINFKTDGDVPTILMSTPKITVTNPNGSEVYYAGDSVDITWTSLNMDTESIKLEVYVKDGGSGLWGWIEMVASTDNDGVYEFKIPETARYGTQYKVRATSLTSATVDSSDATFSIIGTPTINNIQSTTIDGDASVYKDDIVKLSGIVTAIDGGNYFIQDGNGEWNGIQVIDGTNTPAIGDSITIQAIVQENFNLTRLNTVTSYALVSAANTLPAVSVITTSQLTEGFEGVYAKLYNTTVEKDTAFGMFIINDATGRLVVDDDIFAYTKVIGDKITITGIGHYSYGDFKILPRSINDILSASDTVTSSVYTVNNTTNVISNIPYTISVATVKANITACDSATYNIYNADGTTPATVIDDTKKVVVLAADGLTSRTYTITRIAPSADARLSSSVYTIDNSVNTITGVPASETLANFKASISTIDANASFEVYESNGTTIATALFTGYKVIVTAEDGLTIKTFEITLNTVASTEADIITYSINGVNGSINSTDHTVALTLPYGTAVNALIAKFTLSAGASAKVGGIIQVSETTANDFANPVVYAVTAEDATTTVNWTVTVSITPASTDATLSDLTVNAITVAGFDAGTLTYNVTLPFGTTTVPTVAGVATHAGANAVPTQATNVTGTEAERTASVLVTAQDATTTQTYFVIFSVAAATGDLIISEYVEGNSNNRAIELFNPGTTEVDLSQYVVKQSHNGTGWGVDGIAYVLPLEGTLAAGEVYVIAHGQAVAAILAVADTTFLYSEDEGHKVPSFTGNDAIGLFKNDVLVDVIGVPAESTAWNVGDTINATTDNTLVRKYGITTGTTDWAASAGTTADNSQWIVYGIDYLDNIGLPTPLVNDAPEITNVTLSPTNPTTADVVTITATITDDNTAAIDLDVALYWGTAEGFETNEVAFTQEGFGDTFTGSIPAQTVSTIYYLIEAMDDEWVSEYTGSYSITTGINDPASFVSVHIYPNPSNGQFNIELNAQKAGKFDIEIVNVLGQVIYQKQITQDGTHKDIIDISDKAKGLYYIRITDGTSTKVQKLMIK